MIGMGKILGLTTFCASVAVAIFGVFHTHALTQGFWQEPTTSILKFLILSIAPVLTLWPVSKYWRWRFAACLLGYLALETVIVFGPQATAVVASLLLTSLVLGLCILQLTKIEIKPPLFSSLLLGFAVITLILCWSSPFNLNSHKIHLGFTLLILFPGIFYLRIRLREVWAQLCSWSVERESSSKTNALLLSTNTILFSIHLALTSAPDFSHDGLAVHLYIASYMAKMHHWSFNAFHQVFAYMPAATDFLYAHVYLFGNESAVRLLNVSALSLALIAFYRLAIKVASENSTLFCIFLLLSTPLTFFETANLFVENTLTLWITGAAFLIFAQTQFSARFRWLTFCAIAAASMATKMHGAVADLALAIIAIYMIHPFSRKIWISSVLVAIAFSAIGIFPYLKSWIDTGNPVFPFYNDLFLATAFPTIRFEDVRWIHHFNRRLLYDITFHTSRFVEGRDGGAGLTWLVFLPFATVNAFRSKSFLALGCLAVAIISFFIFVPSVQYLRYFFPFLPLLLVAIAVGIDELKEKIVKKILVPILISVCAFNLYALPSLMGFSLFDPTSFFRAETRLQQELRVAPEKPANRFINSLGLENPRVLYPGNPCSGLLEGTALYTNWYSQYFRANGYRIKEPAQAENYLRLINADYVVQPQNPTTSFARAMGAYLQTSGKCLGTFGSVKVYEVPRRKNQ
jgi:hypothetical protein